MVRPSGPLELEFEDALMASITNFGVNGVKEGSILCLWRSFRIILREDLEQVFFVKRVVHRRQKAFDVDLAFEKVDLPKVMG